MLALYIRIIVPVTVLAPVITGTLKFSHLSKAYRIILAYLLLSAVTNLTTILLSISGISNLYIMHWYTIAEFLLLGAFFREQFAGRAIFRRVILVIMFLFSAVFTAYPLVFKETGGFDSYATSLEAILVNLMSIMLLSNSEEKEENAGLWHNYPSHWFNTGILLYFSGSMFLFLASNYLMKAPTSIILLVWGIHATLLLAMYLLFTIGFFKCRKYQII